MMKQEFVALYGKIILEKERLYFRFMYLPFHKTAFARIALELLYVLAFSLSFFMDEGPKRNMRLVMWGFLLLTRLPNLYDVFFKKSFSNRIHLNRIKSVSISDDHHGLQTYVTLRLVNGRYKKIAFRKLENQHEAFVETVSNYITQFQLA